MRLIDADTLIKTVEGLQDCYNGFSDTYDKACIIGVIDEQTSINAVPVVRCKDCKYKNVYRFPPQYRERDYCVKHEKTVDVADFCSWAERRTDEQT